MGGCDGTRRGDKVGAGNVARPRSSAGKGLSGETFMILFFFGEDVFRLQEKRAVLKNAFFEKNPRSTGFFEFDFSDGASVRAVSECLSQTGLFAAKKFVIAGNIFDASIETRRELAEFLEIHVKDLAVDENRILLILQGSQPKKNEKLWKALAAKEIKSQEFTPLGETAILRWTDQAARRAGARGIEPEAQKLLLDVCRIGASRSGEKSFVDMFRLDTEVRKLAAYRTGEVIREEDVWTLSPKAASEETVFQALDALFSGKKKEAAILFSRLAQGSEPLGLLGMCAWQLRNIIRTKGALSDGQIRTSGEAAKLLGMHPFAAGKCFALASRSPLDALQKSSSLLARLDREAKSGDCDPESALMGFVMGM